MHPLRQIGRDGLCALLVLALLCLNFAVPSAAAMASDPVAIALQDGGVCGENPGQESLGHADCVACRLSQGFLLPPPGAVVERNLAGVVAVRSGFAEIATDFAAWHIAAPRGPPPSV